MGKTEPVRSIRRVTVQSDITTHQPRDISVTKQTDKHSRAKFKSSDHLGMFRTQHGTVT
jgi:hypothetical protein